MARSKKGWKLTDEKWKKLEPLLPKPKKSKKGGRPWIDNRRVFEGILWILWTGAPWSALPKDYPSYSTCWRRLKHWEEEGIWENAWRKFVGELDEKGQIDWRESFIDASFAPAKKGGYVSERLSAAREQSLWWWRTARVFLSESTWTWHPRTKSGSRRKR